MADGGKAGPRDDIGKAHEMLQAPFGTAPLLVLTGASGFVGSQLVAQLQETGDVRLLLVSRDPELLAKAHPGIATTDYSGLASHDLTGALIVHMATRNNDRPGTRVEFFATNVDLLISTARQARAGGAARFINLCSTHALTPKDGDLYGESKRAGAEALAAFWPEGAINLYLPAVYGDRLQGKLGKLNALPRPLRTIALRLLRQLKPMVAVSVLAQCLPNLAAPSDVDCDEFRTERFLADPVPASGVYYFAKRSMDLIGALAILVLLSWVMLIVALYVRIDSKGPAIFAQARVGRNGRVFTCYKFRTMATGTKQAASHNVSAAFVTKAGSFLRRTKLDELPQAWNVLCNQMSFVGPRPCLPMQTELVERRRARGVSALKPGITGLAQVHDIDMSQPARLAAWDSRYGAYRTVMMDILLIVRTALGGGSGDRVASLASQKAP